MEQPILCAVCLTEIVREPLCFVCECGVAFALEDRGWLGSLRLAAPLLPDPVLLEV